MFLDCKKRNKGHAFQMTIYTDKKYKVNEVGTKKVVLIKHYSVRSKTGKNYTTHSFPIIIIR